MGLIKTQAEAEARIYREALEVIARTYRADVDREDDKIANEYILKGMNVKHLPDFVRGELRGGTNFITIIKDVREVTGWGLKDAKDYCDMVKATLTSGF